MLRKLISLIKGYIASSRWMNLNLNSDLFDPKTSTSHLVIIIVFAIITYSNTELNFLKH